MQKAIFLLFGIFIFLLWSGFLFATLPHLLFFSIASITFICTVFFSLRQGGNTPPKNQSSIPKIQLPPQHRQHPITNYLTQTVIAFWPKKNLFLYYWKKNNRLAKYCCFIYKKLRTLPNLWISIKIQQTTRNVTYRTKYEVCEKNFFYNRQNFLTLLFSGTFFFLILLFTVTFSTHTTVFTGRDHGAIATAAITLAETGRIAYSDNLTILLSSHYGVGKALNYPGFFYTANGDIIPQFPTVAIVWYALFYTLFGVKGFSVANTITILLSGALLSRIIQIALSITTNEQQNHFSFATSHTLVNNKKQQNNNSTKQTSKKNTDTRKKERKNCNFFFLFPITTILLAYSLPLTTILQTTLSENIMLPLIFGTILLLLTILHPYKTTKKRDKITLSLLFFSTVGLLIFTRIEGIAIAAIALGTYFLQKKKNEKITILKTISIFAGIIFVIFFLTFSTLRPFYITMVKEVLSALSLKENISTNPVGDDRADKQFLDEALHAWHVLWYAGTVLLFIPALVGGILAWKIKNRVLLLSLTIISPTLFYLYDPMIADDVPWILRRYSFTIVPIAILSSLYVWKAIPLFTVSNKKIVLVRWALSLLLSISIFPGIIYISTTPKAPKTLLEQTTQLNQSIDKNTTILVDRDTTGDHFAMIDGPLRSIFGRNAVYIFNPQDVLRVCSGINTPIILITPEKNILWWKEQLKLLGIPITLQSHYFFTHATSRNDGTKPKAQWKIITTPVTIFSVCKK